MWRPSRHKVRGMGPREWAFKARRRLGYAEARWRAVGNVSKCQRDACRGFWREAIAELDFHHENEETES